MPNKDGTRALSSANVAPGPIAAGGATLKLPPCGGKPPIVKIEAALMVSPTAAPAAVPASPGAADELLGSLTTQQQQRTSARVIKKLRLDSAIDDVDRDKRDVVDGSTDKLDADTTLPGSAAKQRMPKALWSSDEKTLFFEALNEYGKDFDAITAHIRAKMKRRGPAPPSAKTKSQVSHFYYRTWHKLSKHTSFDDSVKKVVQELYALINYGEMRRKLSAGASDKTCARLQELITRGTILLRARGRSLRLRTPQCRALRRLNRITECAAGVRVPARVAVELRARSAAAWARVQAAAHNPRVSLSAPLRTPLRAMLMALERRWEVARSRRDPEYGGRGSALHAGPRPGLELHAPTVAAAEPPHTHKICFASYLERLRAHAPDAKIRTPKRQRKDSGTEKEKESGSGEQKKQRTSENEAEKCGLDIEESAIDGIELMATLSTDKDVKPPEPPAETKLEEDLKVEEVEEVTDTEDPKEEEMEREKDSFSEVEEEERCSDGDTERLEGAGTFHNLKVKFRMRAKRKGISEYSVVAEPGASVLETKGPAGRGGAGELDAVRRQVERGWSAYDAAGLTLGDLYLMFGSDSRLELDYWWCAPCAPLSPPPGEPRAELLSPRAHDSDASGDERRRGEEGAPTLHLSDKLRNRVEDALPDPHHQSLLTLTSRLRRLLELARGGAGGAARGGCACGHVCAQRHRRGAHEAFLQPPAAIAPKPDQLHTGNQLCLDEVPRWRRGRPPGAPRDRVVVQRLLPLLPKPTHAATAPELIPVQMVSEPAPAPTPVAILPRPPPGQSGGASYVYILRAADAPPCASPPPHDAEGEMGMKNEGVESDNASTQPPASSASAVDIKHDIKSNFSGFLSSESLSIPCLSPSRLLRDAAGAWPEHDVHDFSLSSFLGHLEGAAREGRPEREEDTGGFLGRMVSGRSQLDTPSRENTTSFLGLGSGQLGGDSQLDSAGAPGEAASFLGQLKGAEGQLAGPGGMEGERRVVADGAPAKNGSSLQAVDTQLQCMMQESSIDYMAKFADLAAEVAAEPDLRS